MADLSPDAIERVERQVNSIFAKVIGGVMLWIGVAFAGLVVWASYAIVLGRDLVFGAVLVMVFLTIGMFCLAVGWRLFFNRPNRFGSILGPLGWRVLGGLFGLMAAGFFILALVLLADAGVSEETLVTAVTSGVGCAVFSYWCFLCARRATSHAKLHGAL